jgi:hypothetical protein
MLVLIVQVYWSSSNAVLIFVARKLKHRSKIEIIADILENIRNDSNISTTTIINQTSTSLNVTSANATAAAKQPQTAPSPINQTASPSSSSSSSAGGASGNQTAAKQQSSSSPPSSSSAGGASSNQIGNNTSANPLAKVPVIGKLFGGK